MTISKLMNMVESSPIGWKTKLMNMVESSPIDWKTLWEKEKLLVTSNFSFFHSVFKRFVLQTRKNQGLFGKRLNCGSGWTMATAGQELPYKCYIHQVYLFTSLRVKTSRREK